MRKKIFLLLSVLVVSLLLVSCVPVQKQAVTEDSADEGIQEAAVNIVSDLEVEADLKKLSLKELDDLIAAGEKEKNKPQGEQAFNNANWLTIAYKVKAEKLAEASVSAGANHAPTFKDFSNKKGSEGKKLEFTVSATDEDGDSLTYDVKDDPPGADLSKSGKFSWTPDFDDAGDYEVTFVVSDGKTTATKTITLSIANTNRLPQFEAEIEALVKVDGVVDQKFDLFLTASDPDGDMLKYGVVSTINAVVDADSGAVQLVSSAVAPFGYPVTLTVTDGIDTLEKDITFLVFPKSCVKNTDCPASYLCQEPTSSCKPWNLDNLVSKATAFCEKGMNSETAQQSCVDKGIAYWTDDTKGHNLCYKIDPIVTLNSCTVTKSSSGKYNYDCTFKAECDYSMQT